jgi:hypothetical protein
MGVQRRSVRGRSLRLVFTPGEALGVQRRPVRRRSLRLIFTPSEALGVQRRSVRRRSLRLIFTPRVAGARGVRRPHQTNCQSDPSNLHVNFPFYFKLTRKMHVIVLLLA